MIKAFSRLALSVVVALGIGAGTVQAAVPDIQVIVNNSTVYAGVEPYVEKGTTMIPIKALQYIPGNSTIWNNTTQTVTVSQDGTVIKLVIGQTTATIGDRTVTLPVAPSLRSGRAMVPLRFLAEAAQAAVSWNPASRTVYVAKTPPQLIQQANGNNLALGREAAVSMPRISKLKSYAPSDDSNAGYTYYFPEGQSFPFFEQRGDVISYYEMQDNHSELVWTAKLNMNQTSTSPIYFLPYVMTSQAGTTPSITGRVAFYDTLPITGATRSGYISPAAPATGAGSNQAPGRFGNITGEVKK